MAALAADRTGDLHKDGKLQAYKVDAAKKIYKGALVSIVAGYLQPSSDTAGHLFCGVAFDQFDNSAGAAGAARADGVAGCRVWKSGDFLFAFSGTAAQANVGLPVYMVDDQTVALAATTTNDVLVGYISEFVSTSQVRVRIDRAVQ